MSSQQYKNNSIHQIKIGAALEAQAINNLLSMMHCLSLNQSISQSVNQSIEDAAIAIKQ